MGFVVVVVVVVFVVLFCSAILNYWDKVLSFTKYYLLKSSIFRWYSLSFYTIIILLLLLLLVVVVVVVVKREGRGVMQSNCLFWFGLLSGISTPDWIFSIEMFDCDQNYIFNIPLHVIWYQEFLSYTKLFIFNNNQLLLLAYMVSSKQWYWIVSGTSLWYAALVALVA